ncbi:hypothetical protein Hdeb2414_s0006g00190881 [Helianthus debilis subsp. tardiflorus]
MLYNQHALFLPSVASTGNVILRNWHTLLQKEEEYHRFKSKAAATMDNLKAAQERLAKEKADFEEYKRTEEWSAAAANEQVRSSTKILSPERKLWYEACTRDNDEFYHILQEIINLKAANAGLAKNETAVVAAIEETILACNRMEEDARKNLQAKDVAPAELNRRLLEAKMEVRAERIRVDAQSARVETEKTKADAESAHARAEKMRVDTESARVVKVKEDYQRVLAQHTAFSGQFDAANDMIDDLHVDR